MIDWENEVWKLLAECDCHYVLTVPLMDLIEVLVEAQMRKVSST